MKKITTKDVVYWLPRVITAAYPVFLALYIVYSSFAEGLVLGPFFGFVALDLVLGLFAWSACKWPKFGAVIFAGLGILIIVQASRTSIGVDWLPIITTAIPLLVAGGLFVYEGFFQKQKTK